MSNENDNKNLIILGIVGIIGLGFLAYLVYMNKRSTMMTPIYPLSNPVSNPVQIPEGHQEQIINQQILKHELEISNLKNQLETTQAQVQSIHNLPISTDNNLPINNLSINSNSKSFVQQRDDARENKLRQAMFGMI